MCRYQHVWWNAIRFYEAKSSNYDGSWHSNFTKRFISRLDIQKGQHVLDLACGTGLLTFLEAEKVGPSGWMIGTDVTPCMLAVATRKQEQDAEKKYSNVIFHNGDILHLEETTELQGKAFDVITVASALVLFPDPNAAIERWSEYLKPGGVLAVDATHPRNLVSGMVLERVARRLHRPIPYNRSWSRSALKYTESLTLNTMKLSEVAERTFCCSCGSPITMEYAHDADRISITMGLVDTYPMPCE